MEVDLAIYFLPESPRWLLLHHYETRGEEARAIIRRFRKFHSEALEEAVEMEVLLMTNSVSTTSLTDSPQPTPTTTPTTTIPSTNATTFTQFALDPCNRIPLVSAILFPIAQQLSGINAVFYDSTLFFNGVIANPLTGTIVAFAVNVVATLLALALMDRLGRKTLLALSAGGMALCCFVLTLSLQGILPPLLTVACVLLYISFFELGLGCIPFFLAGELIQPQFLGTVQSIAMASNWASNFCVGLLFPYMDQFLGAFSFVPFAVVLVATLVYAVWVLPETRGKSLEMVLQELRETHPQLIAQQDEDDEQVVDATLPPNETTTLNEVV
jgi:Sugar (and other) transporter